MPPKKVKRANNKPALTINAQPIPGSFLGRVVKKCGGDWWIAGRVFYRARYAQKVVPFISKGLKEGWLLEAGRDESTNVQAVNAWVEKHVLRMAVEASKTGTSIDGIADILKQMNYSQ